MRPRLHEILRPIHFAEICALLCILIAGCKGESKRSTDSERSTTRIIGPQAASTSSSSPLDASATRSNDSCPLEERTLRHEVPGRLIAIGDLHGDLGAMRRALRLAEAIDEKDQWIGGDLVIVQTGDILDRGDDEQEMLDLFAILGEQARAAGGTIHRLNGNHELMNAMGDFRYVTKAGFADFGESPVPESLTSEPRNAALLPGGSYARKLADFDMVTIVGDSVFVHGGVLPRFVSGLTKANRDARCFLLGNLSQPPEAVLDPEGPLWTRAFSTGDSSCAALQVTLEALKVSRMVVGHTPQLQGITSACEGKVWRIDTGMASYYGGPTQVLQIDKGIVRPLK